MVKLPPPQIPEDRGCLYYLQYIMFFTGLIMLLSGVAAPFAIGPFAILWYLRMTRSKKESEDTNED